MTPETRHAKSGELSIAYQVVGDGPMDLVVVPGWISNIEVFWEDPHVARFFENLATFARLILFDKRGTGLSDRSIEASTLEERMDDVRAVLDAVGSSRAALLGYSEGGTMCVLFAATYPDRTAALVAIGSYAWRLRAPDCPYFTGREDAVAAVEAAAANWGGPVWIEVSGSFCRGRSELALFELIFLRGSAVTAPLTIIIGHAAALRCICCIMAPRQPRAARRPPRESRLGADLLQLPEARLAGPSRVQCPVRSASGQCRAGSIEHAGSYCPVGRQ
jgi:pimeloyl-ACP methyl ester carboxylesterase